MRGAQARSPLSLGLGTVGRQKALLVIPADDDGAQLPNSIKHPLGVRASSDEIPDEAKSVFSAVGRPLQQFVQLVQTAMNVAYEDGALHSDFTVVSGEPESNNLG